MEVVHGTGTAPVIDRKWLRSVTAGFVVCSLALALYLITRHPKIYLTLELSSSTAGHAQLFYNTGKGFNEAESSTAPVSSHSLQSFQRLRFDLPSSTILGLRLDPLTTAGSCRLRNVVIRTRVQALLKIPAADIVPFNQIASRGTNNNEVAIVTNPNATDPGLLLRLQSPFDYKKIIGEEESRVFLGGCALFLGLAVAAYLRRRWLEHVAGLIGGKIQIVDRVFDKVAQHLSTPEFIQFDSYAIWFYALCLAGFILTSMADLNGSSIGMYNSAGEGAPKSVLLGAPRPIRSDEWVYYTPDILNESLRVHRFEVEHSQRGGHNVALMDNVPVRHVATLFRPQFWSFFVLPVDYAFAVYWQFKGLVLLVGIFSWLLLVTGSSFWAITGSLWLFFSPFTQWCYSWASELPEMMGLSCLVMVLFCFLTVGRSPLALALSAWAAATCAIDLALCAYVPHLLPLAYLCVFFVAAWCIASRKLIFQRRDAWRRVFAIGAAVAVTCAIGLVVYVDLKQAIVGIENTTYPGKRIFSGGSLPLYYLTSHFMQWTDTESHFPAALSNICEGSGYLWLAPVSLFLLARLTLSRFQKIALAALWCFSIFILAWLLLPLPAEFGTWFAMTRTGSERCLPALGLANAAIVTLTMAALGRTVKAGRTKLRFASVAGTALGSFCIGVIMLALTNDVLGGFYSYYAVAFSAAFAAVLVVSMVEYRKIVFAVALVLPQAVLFGAVNPVEHGLGVILDSSLYKFVRQHQELLGGKWMVFSDSVVPSGFLAATGSDVYTGMHFLPDIDHLSLFASKGLDTQIFNNGTYLVAHPLYANERSSFQRIQGDVVRWNISPLNPLLKQLGIQYLAFDQKPPEEIGSHLVPLTNGEIDHLWLYKIPE
ncbi:MAG TPA: hypothetical protein VLJ11_07035 [Bryobacteraceae bacterium]|nr:hypothetical protein [Bryobacteraceae bacterium]